MRRFKRILTLCILISYATPCFGNVGVPMIMLGLPFALTLLVPVILVECVVISRLMGMRVQDVCKGVASANAVSTLLGYPLAWLLHLLMQAVATLSFMAIIPKNYEVPDHPLWEGLGFLAQTAWLLPIEASFWWMLPVAGGVGLIPAYFMSVWLELKVLSRQLQSDRALLKGVVRRANLASYSLLVMILLGIMIWNYSTLDHRLQPLKEMALIGESNGYYDVWVGNDRKTEKIVREMLKLKTIRFASFSNDKKIGTLLPQLAQLSDMEELSLNGSDVSNDQLQHLAALNQLKILELRNVPIDGNAFEGWQPMPSLLKLDLSGTKFKDDDLIALKAFPRLSVLKLNGTHIFGKGFAHPGSLENVHDLDLEDSALNDEGMASLATLKNLLNLKLDGTDITDDGLYYVKDLHKLEGLDLRRTGITEQGLVRIAPLKSLKRLAIGNTQISRSALEELRIQFPGVDISFH